MTGSHLLPEIEPDSAVPSPEDHLVVIWLPQVMATLR